MSNPEKSTNLTEVPDAQPTSEEATNKPTSEKTGRKDHKPKKPTKKELARRRKEKAEQERLEAERRQKEEEERKARQLEMEMEKREQERLLEEEHDIKQIRQSRIEHTANIRNERAQVEEWARYTSCDHSTNPLNQADVNSFLSIWESQDNTDMNSLFKNISIATNLLNQLEHLKSIAECSENLKDFNHFSQHIKDIRSFIGDRIASLTQHHLTFSDKYTGAKNEVLLSCSSGDYSYGLWVNLAKNPRVKDIDFGGMSIQISKGLAMTSLAIRMTTMPFLSTYDRYCVLSPALSCEFFQLPAPPKHIGHLTLRQCSSSNSLQSLQYPLRNLTAVQPPLVFKMKIDVSVLPENLDHVTIVKVDDTENSNDLVSNVSIDKETGFVTFSCKTTGIFFLGLPLYSQFPFQFWEINSTHEDSAELFVRTALSEVVITIDKDGLCSSEAPIVFSGLTAPEAIEFLQRRGLNLEASRKNKDLQLNLPDKTDKNLSEKTEELETVLTLGISDGITGFRIRSSKWNAVLPEDRATLVARKISEFGESITEDEDNGEEDQNEEDGEEEAKSDKKEKKKQTRWNEILAKAKHINLVAYTEHLEEAEFKMLPNTNFHQHLMPMLEDIASGEVIQRVKNAPGFISEAVKYLTQKMRLFSVTV